MVNNMVETINAVIRNLRELFKDKDSLVGVDDWDSFIGCLIALQSVASELQTQEEKRSDETWQTEQ